MKSEVVIIPNMWNRTANYLFMKKINKNLLFLIVMLGTIFQGFSQDTKKSKLSFRDAEDNAFDLSEWIINRNGFVPMPILVTEPAMGGFGIGIAPVFIKQNKPVESNGKQIPISPDITALFGAYTLNKSWAVGGARTAYIEKYGLRYSIAAGYGNINMDYYFDLGQFGKDVSFEFDIRTIPVMASLSKQLKDPRFNIGVEYLFMHNELKVKDKNNYDYAVLEKLSEKIGNYIDDYVSGNVAKLGLKASFDSRDNTFTPDKGIKAYISADWSNPVVGSDSKYGQFEGAFYNYTPIRYNWINGFRFDMQQVAGNQPFYLKPFIDMRGVPMARYQGKTTMLAELEERWDFTRRWSLVGFGGVGKAFDKFSEFGDAEWAWGYGGGFRYLMARKLKLRMGVDFAMGPEGFAYYLVFGSSWLRQ